MTSILSGLDFYKLTMSQHAWEVAKDAQVTFTFKNRNEREDLRVIGIQNIKDALAKFQNGFEVEDIAYLRSLKIFNKDFLKYLLENDLPYVSVLDRNGKLAIETTGDWPLVTFWETIVMSTVNDLYFGDRWYGYKTFGHNILSEKIRTLRMFADLRFSDFGTRRRFGLDWQNVVIARLKSELPSQFMGTSNPFFARQYDLKPIGTFAHELPMIYAAMYEEQGYDILDAHNAMLDDWWETYGEEFSIALTDTFGSDFFFATFGAERARNWRGLRHDSGDPFEFGEKAIDFYEQYGIDPKTKVIVFSDGLDLNKILDLYKRFNGRIGIIFGWGTSLMNDVQVDALNIVMKATAVNGVTTVKLSDDEGKHTGDPEKIEKYRQQKLDIFAEVLVG